MKAASLAAQLGFSVACPLLAFIGGGVWADGQLGTKPWLFFLGLVLGLGIAATALYQIAAASPRKRSGTRSTGSPEGGLGTDNAQSTAHSDRQTPPGPGQ